MVKPLMFEKPTGMRDTLPNLYRVKESIRKKTSTEMRQWGYEPIETPTLEYFDTVGYASAILEQQLFKLLDQQGHPLVLRPDMTAPIARIAASTLKEKQRPVRLTYDANVFRAQQREGGKTAEFEQVGVELIGDETVSADGEVIALMLSAMNRIELQDVQVAIGNVAFVHALLIDILGSEERAEVLKRYLYEKNYVGFRRHVESLSLSSIDKRRLEKLLKLRGGREVLDEAYGIAETEEARQALDDLVQLSDVLTSFGVEENVRFDLNLLMHMSYYTGVVFEAYSSNLGYPIGSGGRYDELLRRFDQQEAATGFGLRLDLLVEALGSAEVEQEQSTCLIFSHERRAEAVREAKRLRENGETVVLQDIAGIADVDAFSQAYPKVEYLIGTNGGGSSE
ncbi:ATP phosphoribosyltransferase regulatory subunit [Texcoconibacillus texcoconensis]|uniref:ATP phosphoribosyltransferase regulatory subunit n=1 Tax=Texcoconibacillus texcoconensis TaxID=1095777 RepID=A0A840QPZ8_9BACI|nr:ATP phosphoribosyltransferase regulatory subunit [Texcoconibacillus texcoconensis]MBB5173440.1 ATP phosphoribosyltransferase regulatory subunit [Texcoconibacillus texcoconensis]